MGADSLETFHKWQKWQDIARTFPIAVIDRPGSTLSYLSSKMAKTFAFARIDEPAVRALLGARFGLTADHVLGVWRDCPNAEAFAMRLVPAPPMADRSVSLDEAEAALTDLERATVDMVAA